MFEKSKLKKQVKDLQEQISDVEQKRSRSQAALVEAILSNSTPSDEDTDFFNRYTEEINELRNRLQEVQMELEQM